MKTVDIHNFIITITINMPAPKQKGSVGITGSADREAPSWRSGIVGP